MGPGRGLHSSGTVSRRPVPVLSSFKFSFSIAQVPPHGCPCQGAPDSTVAPHGLTPWGAASLPPGAGPWCCCVSMGTVAAVSWVRTAGSVRSSDSTRVALGGHLASRCPHAQG